MKKIVNRHDQNAIRACFKKNNSPSHIAIGYCMIFKESFKFVQETKFMLRTKNTRKKCYIIVFFRPFQNFAMITRHIDIETKIAEIISLTFGARK